MDSKVCLLGGLSMKKNVGFLKKKDSIISYPNYAFNITCRLSLTSLARQYDSKLKEQLYNQYKHNLDHYILKPLNKEYIAITEANNSLKTDECVTVIPK